MRVRYWWTDDGEGEICDRVECTLEEATACYHCSVKMLKGVMASRLITLNDNEKYIMCVACADKSTQMVDLKQ